jgi:RimJ/RimL family protein N-acetyltransferase
VNIETDRLLLEPWHERRLDEFVTLASDLQVMRHIGNGAPWTREQAEERFRWQLEHWRRHGFGWRSALDRASGKWLGFVGINHPRPEAIELRPDEVEIGWWFSPWVWGRGLATEGATALRDEAFGRLALDRLVSRCRPANVASLRIMERIGMRFDRDARGRPASWSASTLSPQRGGCR